MCGNSRAEALLHEFVQSSSSIIGVLPEGHAPRRAVLG